MDTAYDIPDPTDWLRTPLSQVGDVEAALHCQVCKDFFNTPMITSCCHSFCSLCIRRCLTEDGRCPTCRNPDSVTKLRLNPILEDLVQKFQTARPSMLELARGEIQVPGPRARKRAKIVHDSDFGNESSSTADTEAGRRTSTRRYPRGTVGNESAGTTNFVYLTQPNFDVQPVDDGLAACPICNKRMKEEAVFSHLNVHTADEALPSKPASPGSTDDARKGSKPLARLPQINYSLLKEPALRKKLTELGIPAGGQRVSLVRRHTEWVNLMNANCDSRKPRSKKELLRDLDTWERTQARHSSVTSAKEFDSETWSANHGDHFMKLIAQAKQKSQETRQSVENPAASEV